MCDGRTEATVSFDFNCDKVQPPRTGGGALAGPAHIPMGHDVTGCEKPPWAGLCAWRVAKLDVIKRLKNNFSFQ